MISLLTACLADIFAQIINRQLSSSFMDTQPPLFESLKFLYTKAKTNCHMQKALSFQAISMLLNSVPSN